MWWHLFYCDLYAPVNLSVTPFPVFTCAGFLLWAGEKSTQIPKTTPHHTIMKIKVKKWRMARHPRCVFKSPENSAPGDFPCFLPERAFPFRVEKRGASLSVADGEFEWRLGVLSPCLTQGTWSCSYWHLPKTQTKPLESCGVREVRARGVFI